MSTQPNNFLNSKPKDIVLHSLEDGPRSIEDIANTLYDSGYNVASNRIAKEVAWKLVDEGEAQFNSDWLLEARLEHGDNEYK